MATITIIGSGSLVFTCAADALEGCEIRLMDIDPERLRQSHTIVQSIADRMGARATDGYRALTPFAAPTM